MKKEHRANLYKSKKLIHVSLSYDQKTNVINSVTITGDFFLHPEENLEILEANLIGIRLEKNAIKKIVAQSLTDAQSFGIDVDSMTDAIFQCLEKKVSEHQI